MDIEHSYGWSTQQESESNGLKSIEGHKFTVSSAEAEIWFRVAVERMTAETEVRGRIVGPRCLFVETTQVTWPLRSVWHRELGALIARTTIPNPAFWEPKNPLLYRVVVELWQDGKRCGAFGFDLGFRMIEMGSTKVVVNKQPFSIQGMTCLPDSQEEADDRRRDGYNLVLAGKGQWHWWVRANPMGFLLLERVALSTLTPQYIGLLSQQPCFCGFLVDKELLNRSSAENESFLRAWRDQGVFIGLELDRLPPPSLPDGLSFLVCSESALPGLSTTSIPKLVLRESETGRERLSRRPIQDVLGWIDQ